MSFRESLERIRETIRQHGDNLNNEEMTKQALILPMIEAWGYDTRNPSEVAAEYPVTLRNGSRGRADYVIMHSGKPKVVMECKAIGVPLDRRVQDQMQQYVRALGATAGIVTDGDLFQCFANVIDETRIDGHWFHELQLSRPADQDEDALALFSKTHTLSGQLRAKANEFASHLDRQDRLVGILSDPLLIEELMRLGAIEDRAERESELELTVDSIREIVGDAVERVANGDLDPPEIVTTNEELDAFLLCKGMVHGVVEPHRIKFRDSKTYASVLIDDNNRKPLCRFHFNGRVKYIGTFDADKKETRHAIEDVDDCLKFARKLRNTAKQYAGGLRAWRA